MTWTYGNDPANAPVDAVRLLVGDTDADDPLIEDEAIAFFLAEAGGPLAAAARTARAIAAGFTRAVNGSIDGANFQAGDRYRHFLDLAGVLEAQAAKTGEAAPAPFAGGTQSHRPARFGQDRPGPRDALDDLHDPRLTPCP